MTLAGIELRYLVNKISEETSEFYVSNIYSIDKESILFKLHHPEKPDIFLMISPLGIWITSVKIEQIEQNNLVKRLRNDLLRLKLTKIEQLGAERIAYLTFSGFGKEFILIGEFFGEGNIILCDNQFKILALFHSIDVRHRTLHVGLDYVPPPQNSLNIFEMSKKDISEIKTSTLSCSKWIGRTLGLPTKYAEEICKMSGIDSQQVCQSLDDQHVEKIYESCTNLLDKIVNGIHDAGIVRTEKTTDVYPILFDGIDGDITKVGSFFEGLDTLFSEKIIKKGKESKSDSAQQQISELETRLNEQENAILVVKQKSEKIAQVAKSIMNLVAIGVTSFEDKKVTEILEKQSSKIISEKGQKFIQIEEHKIKINPKSSIPTIASILFDESKHQSQAISSIEELKEKTEKKLIHLRTKALKVKDTITFSEVRKKNWFERYRWFYTSDGFLAIGGRDSSSNSSIIRKHLEKNDKIFHAEVFGSPFFILKNGIDATPINLDEVAIATVCFSRAWREAMYGLSAYWVYPDQVKKAAPTGQFLPKGSFSIDGQRNFLKVSTLKLAVGLLKQDDVLLLCCGPIEPIKKKSICAAIIEPGGSEMVDCAKKIKSEFVSYDERVKDMSIDEFVRLLPAGESHISEIVKGESFYS